MGISPNTPQTNNLGFRWIVELKCNAYGDREQDVTEIREELSGRFEGCEKVT
jgi:hypothetical protein